VNTGWLAASSPLGERRPGTDNNLVAAVLAAVALLAALALALGIHLIRSGATPRISWHRVSFVAVLFWCWYLADAIPLASALSFFLP
jgi:hypothetical protein